MLRLSEARICNECQLIYSDFGVMLARCVIPIERIDGQSSRGIKDLVVTLTS